MKRSHLAHAITFTFGAAILAATTSSVLALESEHGPGDPIDPVPHCPKCAPLPAPADGDDRSMWIDTNGDEEGGKRRLADMWISFETNGKTPGQCGTNDGECDAENCSLSLTVTITNARDEDCPFLECDFQYEWDGVTQPDIPTGRRHGRTHVGGDSRVWRRSRPSDHRQRRRHAVQRRSPDLAPRPGLEVRMRGLRRDVSVRVGVTSRAWRGRAASFLLLTGLIVCTSLLPGCLPMAPDGGHPTELSKAMMDPKCTRDGDERE